jgi:hypothetical protein
VILPFCSGARAERIGRHRYFQRSGQHICILEIIHARARSRTQLHDSTATISMCALMNSDALTAGRTGTPRIRDVPRGNSRARLVSAVRAPRMVPFAPPVAWLRPRTCHAAEGGTYTSDDGFDGHGTPDRNRARSQSLMTTTGPVRSFFNPPAGCRWPLLDRHATVCQKEKRPVGGRGGVRVRSPDQSSRMVVAAARRGHVTAS